MLAIDRQGQEPLNDGSCRLQGRNGFKEGHDIQAADPLFRPKEPRLTGQKQHLEHVRRLGRSADHIVLDRLGRLLLEQRRNVPKSLDDLARVVAERQMRRNQGPRLRELIRQTIEAFIGRKLLVIGADSRPRQNFGEGATMPLAVLPAIQGQHMQSENIHESNEILNQSPGGGFGA